MKCTILPVLALAAVALAAPLPEAEAEASPDYSNYGSYPPPTGGYGEYPKYASYGTYKRVEGRDEKRDYGKYPSVSTPSYSAGES
jgi:hypothetical protein